MIQLYSSFLSSEPRSATRVISRVHQPSSDPALRPALQLATSEFSSFSTGHHPLRPGLQALPSPALLGGCPLNGRVTAFAARLGCFCRCESLADISPLQGLSGLAALTQLTLDFSGSSACFLASMFPWGARCLVMHTCFLSRFSVAGSHPDSE